MKIDLLKLASGKSAFLWILFLIPSPGHFWMAGMRSHLTVIAYMLYSSVPHRINGVVMRKSHQAAGFLHA